MRPLISCLDMVRGLSDRDGPLVVRGRTLTGPVPRTGVGIHADGPRTLTCLRMHIRERVQVILMVLGAQGPSWDSFLPLGGILPPASSASYPCTSVLLVHPKIGISAFVIVIESYTTC